jgi:hypothetical protein
MSLPWVIAFAALWIVILLVAFIVLGLIRRVVTVLERLERSVSDEIPGASLLSVIPPFEVTNESGEHILSEELIREPTIIVFVEAGCEPCRELTTGLGATSRSVGGVPLVLIADERGLGPEFRLRSDVHVVRQHRHEVADLFQSVVTPHAFVVDVGGVVLDRAIPASLADLEMLARRQGAEMRAFEPVRG